MRPNDPHNWTITLYGEAAPREPRHETQTFVGTIEEVLGRADEIESGVEFEVHQFVITRGKKA